MTYFRVRYKYIIENCSFGLPACMEPPTCRSRSKSAHKCIPYNRCEILSRSIEMWQYTSTKNLFWNKKNSTYICFAVNIQQAVWDRDGTGSPGHGSAGHRVSNLGPGRVTGQSPDTAF